MEILQTFGVIKKRGGVPSRCIVRCKDIYGKEGMYSGPCRQEFGRIVLEGNGTLEYDNDGGTYSGEFKDNNINGFGTLTDSDGNTYEGNWLNGKLDGEGIYESYDKFLVLEKVFKDGVEQEVSLMSTKLYNDDEDEEEESEGKRIPLYRTEYSYDENNELTSHTTYNIYDDYGKKLMSMTIDYDEINKLLNEEISEPNEFITKEAIVIVPNDKTPTFEEIRLYVKECAKQILRDRISSNKEWSNLGGTREITNLLQIANLSLDELKNVRFLKPGLKSEKLENIYSSPEFLLNAVGINFDDINSINSDFLTMVATTVNNKHAVVILMDLKKIKELEKSGIDLNDASEKFLFCFDSSGVVSANTYGYSIGELTNICEFICKILQENGTCWLHAAAANIAIAKNPDIVRKIREGTIRRHNSENEINTEKSSLPNEFETKHIMTFRDILNENGIDVLSILNAAINSEFTVKITESFLEDEALISEFSCRIKKLALKNEIALDEETIKKKIEEECRSNLEAEIKSAMSPITVLTGEKNGKIDSPTIGEEELSINKMTIGERETLAMISFQATMEKIEKLYELENRLNHNSLNANNTITEARQLQQNMGAAITEIDSCLGVGVLKYG
ncbi:MAG: hypothetical protein LBI29_01130 [Rickettsiales bacterium]|jgi:hypothetical protein|nr:hypothetical protein [Rickettsiales bacterium]